MDPNYIPKLRPLIFIKTKLNDKDVIVAQDPTQESQAVALQADLEGFLRMLDGKNSLRDIQLMMTRAAGGEIVDMTEITEVVDELDSVMLLDSPRYRETVALDKKFWDSQKLRKPSHAGQAYPADADELQSMLDGFYKAIENKNDTPDIEAFGKISAVLAPHIDIKSGGATFARAYRAIKNLPKCDLYAIVGTAHGLTPGPVSISRKNFLTPLGVLETDNDLIDKILEKYSPPWLVGDDSAHRNEHSIEFQAVFLNHILGAGDYKILPVLVGGFGEFVEEKRRPAEDDEISKFINAFKSAIDESGKKVLFIIGGDLAHIGPRYGERDNVLPSDVEACKKKDLEMLDAAAGGADPFFDYVSREKDGRHICGMPPLYLTLKLIGGSKGRLIEHSHWFDRTTRSAVTFAAMIFG